MKERLNKKELINIIIVYAIVLAIMIVASAITSTLSDKGVNIPVVLKMLLIYGLLLIPPVVYTKKKGDSFVESLGLKSIKISTFFKIILLTIVSSPMYIFANALSQLFVPNTVVQSMDNFFSDSVVFGLLTVAVMAPIAEEIICRGFFQNRLKGILPFGLATTISGFMFGLLHLNLNQFCYAWVLGIIFAYANRATGSIFSSMIMHFCINGTNFLFLLLVQAALKTIDMDLGEVAETARNNNSAMYSAVLIWGVLAIASFFLTRLVLKSIAKTEGTEEIISTDEELEAAI
ncbi:hypothetical protein SAMN02910384_02689 [Pseudobutyrivibrio sp. ACV-2]|uniref:CPBP family intramembrane glutamic endopeptidase n=1 Tax=Pseudobutyrivibrio sp. ACV-2 TaxID=1520801 RepID=UPI00089BC666|nr:type II CAAX endopeptidase family protein [Pseudobutyrivibrio sp. ACV-2]SEA90665.1 hypothetical protein SAMN02910384_02689 [Pseudobutyrivibrio sp. ACV-2]